MSHPTSHPTMFITAAAAALSASLAGCALTDDGVKVAATSADDVVRVFGSSGDDVARLTGSKWAPRKLNTVPPPPPTIWDEAVGHARGLAQRVTDVPAASQVELVSAACQLVDAVEAGASPESVYEYLLTRTSTPVSYRIQFEGLANDLYDAGSSSDVAVLLGRTMLCLAVSSA